MREYHGLAAQRTHFCAANIEHIRQLCQIRQGQVACRAGQTISQPCTVHKQRDLVLGTDLVQGFQLCLCVQRAILSGVGDIHHAGEGHVLVICVGIIGLQILPQIRGRKFSIRLRQRQHFMPCIFHGACLMAVDMAGSSGHNPFVPAQHRRNNDNVGLCPARNKEHIRLRAAASRPDLLPGTGTIGVCAITRGLFQVGLHQFFQNLFMGAFTIIIFKIQHGSCLLCSIDLQISLWKPLRDLSRQENSFCALPVPSLISPGIGSGSGSGILLDYGVRSH